MRYRIVELLTAAVVVVLLVGGAGWALITWGPGLACQNIGLLCPPAPGQQELAPYVEEYLAAAGAEIDAAEYMTGLSYEAPLSLPPYRIGKVAAVNVTDRVIDGKLTRALPADMVATRPEDVGTVIWVRWGESHEGTYRDEVTNQVRGEAYRGYCGIVVIDLAAGVIVGTAHYHGPNPPATTTSSGDVHTQVDIDVVVNWIKTLPVRDSSTVSPTPSTGPTPTGSLGIPGGPQALEPGESVTLSGAQSERAVVIPADRLELLAGEYSIVFKGRASKACANCMAVKVLNERDDYPIFVVNDPARIAAGRWSFTGVFTIAGWEEGASFHFELNMPKGSWTITLTRES